MAATVPSVRPSVRLYVRNFVSGTYLSNGWADFFHITHTQPLGVVSSSGRQADELLSWRGVRRPSSGVRRPASGVRPHFTQSASSSSFLDQFRFCLVCLIDLPKGSLNCTGIFEI